MEKKKVKAVTKLGVYESNLELNTVSMERKLSILGRGLKSVGETLEQMAKELEGTK